jgi:hypothetical protein
MPRRSLIVVAVASVALISGVAGWVIQGRSTALSPADRPALVPSGAPGACSSSPVPTQQKPVPIPTSGVLFGASTPRAGFAGTHIDGDPTFGRCLDIVHFFYPGSKEFGDFANEKRAISRGQTPMISWNANRYSDITTGKLDSDIEVRAAALKGLGAPVFLRWAWEMDRPDKISQFGSPEEYIAAWKYLKAKFTSLGVANATWVWCPTSLGFSSGRAQPFYPGDDQVDWIAADGYSAASGDQPERSFPQIFDSFYRWAEPRGKPLMVAEFGVEAGSERVQVTFLDNLRKVLRTTMPAIKAIVYWNSAETKGGGRNYRLDAAGCTVSRAIRALSSDAYFNPKRQQLQPDLSC